MENYVYEKKFPFPDDINWCDDPEEVEKLRRMIYDHRSDLPKRAYSVRPDAPALFAKTVEDCERIAETFAGRIKATINYSSFHAVIELWCCYVEFRNDEFMSTLHELSRHAASIVFMPLTSGDLHIQIEMPYFTSDISE